MATSTETQFTYDWDALQHWKCCDHPRKRGKRGGIRAKTTPHGVSLPSLLQANARSHEYKMREVHRNMVNPWHPGSRNCTGWAALIQSQQHSGKRRGGLCVYVNHAWCSKRLKWMERCSPDVEWCRPYYLPREFTSDFLSYSVLYIQPDANSKNALQELSDVISSSMTKQPDGIFRVDSWF